jgi:hypothetical protein
MLFTLYWLSGSSCSVCLFVLISSVHDEILKIRSPESKMNVCESYLHDYLVLSYTRFFYATVTVCSCTDWCLRSKPLHVGSWRHPILYHCEVKMPNNAKFGEPNYVYSEAEWYVLCRLPLKRS